MRKVMTGAAAAVLLAAAGVLAGNSLTVPASADAVPPADRPATVDAKASAAVDMADWRETVNAASTRCKIVVVTDP
jgi:hypothetical protein